MAARANAQSNELQKESYKIKGTEFYDIIPQKIYAPDFASNQKLVKKMMGLISMFPNTIFNFLLHQKPYVKFINETQIQNYAKIDVNSINTNDQFTLETCIREVDDYSQFETEFIKYIKDDKKRFMFGIIKLGLKSVLFKKMFMNHMNSFIIDKKEGRIIRFEPKGMVQQLGFAQCNLNIEEIIGSMLSKHKIERVFAHINTSAISYLLTGPQYFNTHCQTFSLYFGLLYLMNPDIKTADIYGLIKTMNEHKVLIFQDYIHKKYFKSLSEHVIDDRFYSSTLAPIVLDNANSNGFVDLGNNEKKTKTNTKTKTQTKTTTNNTKNKTKSVTKSSNNSFEIVK